MRAGQPLAVASDGMTIQTRISTPSTPTAAPVSRSHSGNGSRIGTTRWTSNPIARPDGLADRCDEHEEQQGDGDAIVGGGRPERGDDAGQEPHCDGRVRARRRPTRTHVR